jgi:PqqD family protein of HPr-rel-A system
MTRQPVTTMYHAPDPADLSHAIDLDGFALIYHRPSGQTHLLAEPAPQILAALAQGPATPATILQRLAAVHGLESEDDAEAVVAERLAELAAIGLIERR